jgi:hypothetical protein
MENLTINVMTSIILINLDRFKYNQSAFYKAQESTTSKQNTQGGLSRWAKK